MQPVDRKNETIFGQSLGVVEKLLGMKAFREKYVDKESEFARQEMTAELEAWACQVDFAAASVQLVCCPEDKFATSGVGPKVYVRNAGSLFAGVAKVILFGMEGNLLPR